MAIITYYRFYEVLKGRLTATATSAIECEFILYNEEWEFKKECHVCGMMHIVTWSAFIKLYAMWC